MSLDADTVKKIAHLSRLAISNEDIPAVLSKLDTILNLVNEMNKIDTSKVTPMAHPMDETQPLRIDEVSEINQRTLFLENAPEAEAGMFIVPQFVEN